MKKIYTTLFAAAAIVAAAVSCGKAESEAVSEGSGELKVNISVAPLGPDTKAIKKGWEAGDIINVWLDDIDVSTYRASDGPDFTLTYDGKEWTAAGLSGKESRLKATGGKLRGFWEGSNSCFKSTGGWFFNQEFVCFPSDNEPKTRTGYLVACFNIGYEYDKAVNKLEADIDEWTFGMDFHLVVSGLNFENKRYAMYSQNIYAVGAIATYTYPDGACKVTVSNNVYTGKENGKIACIANDDGVAFVGKVPSTQTGYTFTIVDTNTGKEYSFTKTATLENDGKSINAIKISKDKFVAADGSKLGD